MIQCGFKQCRKKFVHLRTIIHRPWLFPLPIGHRAIDCKCVFKIKFHFNISVEHYKAQHIAKGFA
jgi:hypothetical protein